MYDNFGWFIDGVWRRAAGGARAAVFSPVTEQALGEVPMAGVADTEEAIAAAVRGFAAWRAKQAFDRADALHAVADEMIRDAAQTLKTVSMELGGTAPLIVYDDADLDLVLNVSVPTQFANAGQVCVTPDRFFVHEAIHDAFVRGFVERTLALTLGDGLDPATQMGPLIDAGRRDEIEAIVDEARPRGARVACGGRRVAGFARGHFCAPTVLTEVGDDASAFAQENFGPIAAITRFASDDEVLARANASDMGLSADAFTTRPKRARRTVAERKASPTTWTPSSRRSSSDGNDRGAPVIRNRLEASWAAGRPSLDGGLSIGHSFSAEVMAAQGHDSLCIDLQHGALDAAADGVICPMVDTAQQAAAFVSCLRDPPHVLVAGKLHRSGMALLESAPGVSFDGVDEVSEASDAPLIDRADALVIRTQPLSAATVARAPKLRIVSRHGVGYDAVDLPALVERGIALAVVGDVNSISVAEHSMMLLLTPHIAGLTAECAERMAVGSVQNVLDFFSGRIDPALVVNRAQLRLAPSI